MVVEQEGTVGGHELIQGGSEENIWREHAQHVLRFTLNNAEQVSGKPEHFNQI